MTQNNPHSKQFRQARTRTLIQLGGLLEKSGLIEELSISLGSDLQKDVNLKAPVSLLMGALLHLKLELKDNSLSRTLLQERGMKALAEKEI